MERVYKVFVKFSAGMEPRINGATLALGELGRKMFDEYNEATEFGFRVRVDKLLAIGLKKVRVKNVSKNLDVVEILE